MFFFSGHLKFEGLEVSERHVSPLINTSGRVLQILCATSNPQVSAKIYNPFQYLEATEGFGEGRNNDFGCFYTARQAFNYLTRLVYTSDCLTIWPQFYQFQNEKHRRTFEYILEMSATLLYTSLYEILKIYDHVKSYISWLAIPGGLC